MVGRPAASPTTALGEALRERRGDATQRAVAEALGVTQATLARIERGTHEPSTKTALALARWLGWSVERVLEAAKAAAPDAGGKS